MFYKSKYHPKLLPLLREKSGSCFQAAVALEIGYDRLMNIARGRARATEAEVKAFTRHIKVSAKEMGFER